MGVAWCGHSMEVAARPRLRVGAQRRVPGVACRCAVIDSCRTAMLADIGRDSCAERQDGRGAPRRGVAETGRSSKSRAKCGERRWSMIRNGFFPGGEHSNAVMCPVTVHDGVHACNACFICMSLIGRGNPAQKRILAASHGSRHMKYCSEPHRHRQLRRPPRRLYADRAGEAILQAVGFVGQVVEIEAQLCVTRHLPAGEQVVQAHAVLRA